MEMKATGMYISRGLSFKAAEFTPMNILLDTQQEELFDTACAVWTRIKSDIAQVRP
jgi:hypothetical protein